MENFTHKASVNKLKELVENNKICLFCIDLKADDGSSCSPMQALHVCDQGNIWFLSDVDSEKNSAIKKGNHVQLIFSHSDSNSFFIVNGQAEIIIDQEKAEELWEPVAQNWFADGKNDPNISIIKVKPQMAYYWDTNCKRMISFFKVNHNY
ncbi:pyridoxamine 5'-phosphate oxidase family protein [Paucihalobacter sp.]|uniref:pyridoxamine 5'-phosphate oxidase family protein n=1 Tax=Paucihalobacter sp. TaxID=2850405 RepID=UPI002FE1F7E4